MRGGMTYRAGIIGAGGIAGMGVLGFHDDAIGKEKIDSSHAGGIDATETIELVDIGDVDEEKLETFGEAWEIPPGGRYVGHEAMLAAEDLDVVSVCNPLVSPSRPRRRRGEVRGRPRRGLVRKNPSRPR